MKLLFLHILLLFFIGCSSTRTAETRFSASLEEHFNKMESVLLEIRNKQNTNVLEDLQIKEKIRIYDTGQPKDSTGNYPLKAEIERDTNKKSDTSVENITDIARKEESEERSDKLTELDNETQETQKNCRSPAQLIVVLILVIVIIILVKIRFR